MLRSEGIARTGKLAPQRQVSFTRSGCTRKTFHQTQIPARCPACDEVVAARPPPVHRRRFAQKDCYCLSRNASISGLVVEYIVAIDVTQVRFPADAFHVVQLITKTELPPAWLRGVARRTYFGERAASRRLLCCASGIVDGCWGHCCAAPRRRARRTWAPRKIRRWPALSHGNHPTRA